MGEAAGRIALYHNLFVGCLAAALLCLILAAVLFFILDIKAVLGYLTGRQRRKKVKEMEAANAVSGRLMRERSSMQHVAREMKEEMGVRQASMPGARRVERAVETQPAAEIPAAVHEEKDVSPAEEETALLSSDTQPAADGTTEVLTGDERENGVFRIERELILIHTEEVI